MVEAIVGGIHDNSPETDTEGEEWLRHSCVPYWRIEDLLPGWFKEEYYSIDGPFQRDCPYQKSYYDHVWKYGEEVRCFPAALHAVAQHYENERPADKQSEDQLPRRKSQTFL